MKNGQKAMLLAAAALISVGMSACGQAATSSANTSTVTSSTVSYSNYILDIALSAYSTDNFATFASLSEGKEMMATLKLPGTWLSQGPNLIEPIGTAPDGKPQYMLKGYVGGIVYLKSGQKLPDTLDNSKTKYNVVSESNVTINDRTAKLRIVNTNETPSGSSGPIYRYEYYYNVDDKVFMISFYTDKTDDPETTALYERILKDLKLYQSTAQQQAAASEAAAQ